MKHILLLAFVALLGMTDAVAQKFGHLDAQDILLTLPERAEAQASIEAAAAEYETEVSRMQSELETKFADYQAKAAHGLTLFASRRNANSSSSTRACRNLA